MQLFPISRDPQDMKISNSKSGFLVGAWLLWRDEACLTQPHWKWKWRKMDSLIFRRTGGIWNSIGALKIQLVTPQSLRLPEKEIGNVSKSFLPGSFAFGGINTHFWTYPNQVVGYLSHLYPTYISSLWLVLIPHCQTALQLIGNILIAIITG